MSKRVVIIGAGPGGLASSLLLAKSGYEVVVLERGDRIGGRTSCLERDGFRWDVGPTFFLYPEILREIFAEVGADLDIEAPTVRLDPQYRIEFGEGGRLDATADPEAMRRQIEAISPRDGPGFQRFLDTNRGKLEAFRPVLERPFNGLRDLLSLDLLAALPKLRPWASLDTDLKRFFHDPRIRLAFSFQSKYLGMSPFRCPSLFSILSYLEYAHGVHHPIGGCHALMEAMARVARRMGVEFRMGEAAEALVFEGRRVTGVETSRESLRAAAVVINGDFARVVKKLVPDRLRKRWNDKRIEKSRYSCSTFMMYLGIEGRYEEQPHHTIHISSDYKNNLREIEKGHVLSRQPSFYIQNPCITDPSLAPEGKSSLYVLVPVSHQHENIDWSVERGPYRELVLDRLESSGLAGIRDRIVSETVYTPDDWASKNEIHLGATFNLSHDLGQMLHLRPRNRFGDVESLYLVGGGTHPGSGLPVIFESAKITSRLLAEDLGRPLAAGASDGAGRPREMVGAAV